MKCYDRKWEGLSSGVTLFWIHAELCHIYSATFWTAEIFVDVHGKHAVWGLTWVNFCPVIPLPLNIEKLVPQCNSGFSFIGNTVGRSSMRIQIIDALLSALQSRSVRENFVVLDEFWNCAAPWPWSTLQHFTLMLRPAVWKPWQTGWASDISLLSASSKHTYLLWVLWKPALFKQVRQQLRCIKTWHSQPPLAYLAYYNSLLHPLGLSMQAHIE